jgi:imidazolonepropionase-like amidohydrolase
MKPPEVAHASACSAGTRAGALPLLLLYATQLWSADSDTFLIRNTDVYPVTRLKLDNVSLLVENGRITEIAAKITVPKGVRVIEGKGLRVYPGMIDSATQLGLAEIQQVRETLDFGELGAFMPQLRALTAINPASEHFPVVRVNGITTVMTFPSGDVGNRADGRQFIAGQSALVHTDGWTWEEMAVKGSAAMHLIFPTLVVRRPGTFGGGGGGRGPAPPPDNYTEAKRQYDQQITQLADFFGEARRYQNAKAAARPGFRKDLKYEAMLPVLEGKLPVAVTAPRERAIRDAIAFANKEKIRIVILEPREIGKTAADLKARNIPVILGQTLDLPRTQDDSYDAAFTLPAELYRAGIKFAFGTFNNQFVRDLPYNAGTAVAFGLPYDEALKALTINPAEIWGVADQLGSLEKGKSADLMVLTGDPLETPTQVKHLFIKGKEVDLTNKQTRLNEKYLNRP